jgi:membrane protein
MIDGQTLWRVLKRAVADFFRDDVLTEGSALAFYTALSLAPLLVILLGILGLLGNEAQASFVHEVGDLVGPRAAPAIEEIVESADQDESGATISTIVGLVVLFFSATTVFAQLQSAINRIWNVEARPGRGLRNWIRKRILSAAMIFGVAFLLMVSLAVSAAINYLVSGEGTVWQVVNFVVSFSVFTAVFAATFRFLPDVTIGWNVTWIGGAITAVLFSLGKLGIGTYLGVSTVGSSYGAAGSLVVLLVWVYYSALIIFFGAEITQAYAIETGARFQPHRHAQWRGPDPYAKTPPPKE